VSRSDVDAALALMTCSQASITPDIERRVRDDPISRVYQAVRTHALRTRQAEVSMDTIRQLVAFDSEINKVGRRAGGPLEGRLGWGRVGWAAPGAAPHNRPLPARPHHATLCCPPLPPPHPPSPLPPLPAPQDAAIEQCIREYEGIAVWAVTRDATSGAIASVRFPEEDIALAV
jgi:hypothetical protein